MPVHVGFRWPGLRKVATAVVLRPLVARAALALSVLLTLLAGAAALPAFAAPSFCVPTNGHLGSLGYSSSHKALDILTSQGSGKEPVYAAQAGIVRWISRDNTNDPFNVVVIEHNFGDGNVYRTVYIHMGQKANPGGSYIDSALLNAIPDNQRNRTTASVNVAVFEGQRIGYQGDAGRADAVHLHFQLQVNPKANTWPDNAPSAVDPRAGWLDGVSPGATDFHENCPHQNQGGEVTVTGTVREEGRPLAGIDVDVRRASLMDDFQFITTDRSGRYTRSFSQGAGEPFAIAVGENDAHGYLNRNKEFDVRLDGGTHTVDVDLPTFAWNGFNCDRRSNTCSLHVQGSGYFTNGVGVTLYAWAVPVAPNLIPLSTVSVDSTGHLDRTVTFPRPPAGDYTVDAQQRFNDPCNCGFLPNAEARPPRTFTVR